MGILFGLRKVLDSNADGEITKEEMRHNFISNGRPYLEGKFEKVGAEFVAGFFCTDVTSITFLFCFCFDRLIVTATTSCLGKNFQVRYLSVFNFLDSY